MRLLSAFVMACCVSLYPDSVSAQDAAALAWTDVPTARRAAARSADSRLGRCAPRGSRDRIAERPQRAGVGERRRALAVRAAADAGRRAVRARRHVAVRPEPDDRRRDGWRCVAVLRAIEHGAAGRAHVERRRRDPASGERQDPAVVSGSRRQSRAARHVQYASCVACRRARHGSRFLRHLLLLRARAAEDRSGANGSDPRLVGRLEHRSLDQRQRARDLGRLQRADRAPAAVRRRSPGRRRAPRRGMGGLVARARADASRRGTVARERRRRVGERPSPRSATGRRGAFQSWRTSTGWSGSAAT